MRVGFIGLGTMGRPMALNLARAGTPLVVWNRSPESSDVLARSGASVAPTPAAVFEQADVVILMLANGEVIDEVLERGTPGFAEMVRGRTVVHMGTTSAAYSRGLADAVAATGGTYVEAPVSGSRRPAEAGELVGMLAGAEEDVEDVLPLLAPMCSSTVRCGPVPRATQMKLAVNHVLITQVAGLVEAFQAAAASGLDLETFRAVLDSGPLASAVSRVKLDKLVRADFEAQASISDVLYNNRLVVEAAHDAGVRAPLLESCRELFAETEALGHGHEDMAAVLRAFEARSASGPRERGLDAY